jgi:hypothetical protein
MEDGLQVDVFYTDFLKAFDRVKIGLFLGTMTRKFRGSMIFWMGSYLTGRTQRVRVGDYLYEKIYCHSGVPQGSHLSPLFFIADINDGLDIFEKVGVLAYADDLKLFMRVSSTYYCRLFQQDLDSCIWLLSGQVWSMHLACGRLIKRIIRRGFNAFNTTLLDFHSEVWVGLLSLCFLMRVIERK